MGTAIQGQIKDFTLGDIQLRITPKELIRGDQAWTMIHQANMFNSPPKDGFEYVLVRITFEYLKGTDPNAQYDLSPYNFTAVSSDGRDYDSQFVVSPKPELNAKLYPGAAFEGWVPFEINTFDKTPLLTFGRDYVGRGGLWWKLYQ